MFNSSTLLYRFMALSVTQSFYQGGAFPQQRNRWLSSLRNIEQENNFEGETVYWTDVWLSLQYPEIHLKPLSLGYVQGNDNFVSFVS